MLENNLFVMDKDPCPDNDQIIYKDMCSKCSYYKGFEINMGQRCIRCSFYEKFNENITTNFSHKCLPDSICRNKA